MGNIYAHTSVPLRGPNLPTQRLHFARLGPHFTIWQKDWGRVVKGLENINAYISVPDHTQTFPRSVCTLLDSRPILHFGRKTGGERSGNWRMYTSTPQSATRPNPFHAGSTLCLTRALLHNLAERWEDGIEVRVVTLN